MKYYLFLFVVLSLVLLMGGVAFAQPEASITATATVLSPLTISGDQNLNFGDVLPGVNSSVDKTTDAGTNAGKFSISGNPSSEINLAFTALPSTLSDGSNTLSISFSSTDAGHTANSDGSSQTAFDPSSSTTATLSTGGNLYVFLGGTVQPTHTQTAGTYTGTVTLQIYYTGN